MLNRVHQPAANFRVIVGPHRYGRNLKAGSLMTLQHAGHQQGYRMFAEVGGDIRDADSVVAIWLTLPDRSWSGRAGFCGPKPGAFELIVGGGGESKKTKRPGVVFAFSDRCDQMFAVSIKIGPIAKAHLEVQTHAFRTKQIRVERQRLVETGASLIKTPEIVQDVAAAGPGPGKIRLQRNRFVEARQRFIRPFEIVKDIAPR